MFASVFWKMDGVKCMARSPEGQEDGSRDQKKAKSRSKRRGQCLRGQELSVKSEVDWS